MLTKIVLKMLLKLTLSIVCMVGVMSYGMHLRGGDPGALLAKVTGGALQSAKSSVQGAGNSIKMNSPIKSKTTVYQWVDANGVTQFGSAPPAGVASQEKSYNNNANLMNAQKPMPSAHASNDGQEQPGFGPDGERLPGVAGMNFPTSGDPEKLKEFLQALQESQ